VLFLVLVASVGVFIWSTVESIRNPTVDPLPSSADAVMVFAGEDARFTLGRELVEAGVAPVLVLNDVALPDVAAGWCDEEISGFEVVCLTPENGATRGEAQAFGALATDSGWESLVGVTGDYHQQRSKMLLERCFGGSVVFAQVAWPAPSFELVKSEVLAIGHASTVQRSC
jgi:uncharacterized SAM-binding protein YcdF (DUF218 family)